MKARDIIPGWPRGKSTSGPTTEPWLSQTNIYEARVELLYHAEQQFMVDEYLGHGWFWRRAMLEACFEPTNRTATGCTLL